MSKNALTDAFNKRCMKLQCIITLIFSLQILFTLNKSAVRNVFGLPFIFCFRTWAGDQACTWLLVLAGDWEDLLVGEDAGDFRPYPELWMCENLGLARLSNNWNIHSQSLNVTAPISFNTSNWNHPILDNQRLNLRDISMLMSTKQSPDVGYIRANKFVKLFKLTSRISRLAGYRCFGIVMRFSGIITRFSIFFLLKSLKKIHKCLFVINTKYGE